MAEIVSLRLARKAKARAAKEATAAANRAAFGRSKVEKAAQRAEADRLVRALDNIKREGEANNS